MSDDSKDHYVEHLHQRTKLSKKLLAQFVPGDLKTYFERSANPELARITGAAFVFLLAGAAIGFSLGTVPVAVSAAAGVAALGSAFWHNRLKGRNDSVIGEITERVTAVAPKAPGH